MPELSTVHISQALTNVAIGYPMSNFIAPRLLAEVPVAKQTDYYYIFDTVQEKKRQSDDNRRPGAAANEVDFAMTSATYTADGHALATAIPDEVRANSDAPIQPDLDATENLVSKLMVGQEVALKTALDAAVTVNTSDPTNEWDDYTNGDPIADFKLAINTIEDAVGITPNVVAMDTKVWRALKFHPAILSKVLYGGTNANPAMIGPEAIAALFDLEEVIIGNGLKNTAVKGQAASLSRIWGSDVYIGYRPGRAGLRIPAGGYRFTWAPFSGSQMGFAVKRWRDDKRGADMIQVEKYYDQKITLALSWYRLQNRLT